MPTRIAVAVIAAGLAVLAILALRNQVRDDLAPARPEAEPDARPAAPEGRPGPPERSTPPAAGPGRPLAEFVATLADGLATSPEAARAAASALRRRLREDPEAFRAAAASLLDPERPEEIRAALALVIGTIGTPDTDAALLRVLADTTAGVALRRAALLALGAMREPPDDDEIFGLGDRPYGQRGPGGLGITVRREIPETATRAAIVKCLAGGDAGLRKAAANALRHSLSFADARDVFRERLGVEPDDGVAAPLGEALAARARRAEDPVERDLLVDAVLLRAAAPGFDGLRFKVEDDLAGVALPESARTAIEELTSAAHPFGERAFALTVLARSAEASGERAVAQARALLHAAVSGAPELPVRDLAARLLRDLPHDAGDIPLLTKAAREDPAWNVRYTALETLAKVAPRDAARPVLEAATKDADPRVVELAQKLLGP